MNTKSNPLKFHGKGGEFFGIWIVNLLLTIVTLGIYSAWAHVRTAKYFYGNTELENDRFEYVATPKQILIGRLIAIGLFFVYAITARFAPILAGLIAIGFLFTMPWIAQRSLKFNAQMSRYRGVRFDFKGSVGDAYMAFLGRPILAYLGLFAVLMVLGLVIGGVGAAMQGGQFKLGSLGILPVVLGLLLLPVLGYMAAWISKGIASYIHNGYCYGDQQFSSQFSSNVFFKISVISMLIFFGIVAIPMYLMASTIQEFAAASFARGSAPSPVLMTAIIIIYLIMIVASLIASAYHASKIRNYTFEQTFIGNDKQYRFGSTVKTMPYLGLLITNFLMIVFTFGLLFPFARVRHAKFMADATQIHGDLSTLSTSQQALQKTSAIGDGLAQGIDVNLSF